jgi:hypothetical protein
MGVIVADVGLGFHGTEKSKDAAVAMGQLGGLKGRAARQKN